MDCVFRGADLSSIRDQQHVVSLLSSFSLHSSHPQALPEATKLTICANLQDLPTTLIYFADYRGTPVGIAICFRSFSTFQNAPVLNIHDLYVEQEFQGKGIGKKLLGFLESQAKANGFCRVTLEVYKKNARANAFFRGCEYAGGDGDKPEDIMYALSKKIT